MANKATMQQEEAMYAAMFGEECPSNDVTLSEINESIDECQAMLDYSLNLANKEEIAFWRKMLQRAKVERREILAAI